MRYLILILLLFSPVFVEASPLSQTFLERDTSVKSEDFPVLNNALVPHTIFNTETSVNALYELIEDIFPPDEVDIMYKIALCESDGLQFKNGKVVTSHTLDYGVFQLHAPIWDSLANELRLEYKEFIEHNVRLAYEVYNRQGKKAWVCYNEGLISNH